MRNKKAVMMIMLLAVLSFKFSCAAMAEEQAKTVPQKAKGVNYNANVTIADNLKALKGKPVTVMLVSGEKIQGIVKSVGNTTVHIEKIALRNYFDALIQIGAIIAIETQFRG